MPYDRWRPIMPANRRTQEQDVRSNDPNGPLESALIDEFLAERGHTLESITKLAVQERRELLRRAASYATLRLAEIEARAHLVDDLER
jgi:hypothetical protein